MILCLLFEYLLAKVVNGVVTVVLVVSKIGVESEREKSTDLPRQTHIHNIVFEVMEAFPSRLTCR